MQIGSHFPKDVEEALDGFIENPIELMGLLKICRDARDGRSLSRSVLMAAHLMTKEVLQALVDSEAAGDFRV
ncbi:hypothetical protein RLEG12_07930 (plasmid) [Rhizobium leguminosarum bv. trifolii CB782]|nr:hypothetical protein RLEG12_07930 [Rhizobium leguminosarum bv. trifolii CB782]